MLSSSARCAEEEARPKSRPSGKRQEESQMTIPRDASNTRPSRPAEAQAPAQRIVVWTIVNLEVWDISRRWRARFAAPTGVPLLPTYRTGAGTSTACAWASGVSMRSTETTIKPACHQRARVRGLPPSRRRARTRAGSSWDSSSRDRSTAKRPAGDDPRPLDTIEQFTGKRPVGWLGRG